MAETLSFSSGSFTLSSNTDPGTEKLAVDRLGPESYEIENRDGSTIVGLGVQADDTPLKLLIDSDANTTLSDSTLNFGKQDDFLLISSKTKRSEADTGDGDDRFRSGNGFNGSQLDMSDGNDRARLLEDGSRFVAKNSSFDMGSGDDRIKFAGNVKNINVDLGTGKDTLIFGGNIDGAKVNMGGADGAKDTIVIDGGAKIEGLKIEGAEIGDVLFIGSTQYDYNAQNNTWVSGNDVRRFD